MTCGIYMIQNLVNGKIYIGQSVDIEGRWRRHRRELRGNDHDNKHLQNAWNKYKEDNFEFTIICECDESQLNTLEIDYIAKLKTYNPDFGYNKTYGGEGGRHTEETRRKQSEAQKGKNNGMYGKHHSDETRRKIGKANKGRTHTEETKRKQSEAHKGENNHFYGKHHSEETKQKLSESLKGENHPFYGKHHSEETKEKMSEALKGENHPFYGKHHSEETKEKMSESLKGKYCGKNNPMYGKHHSEEAKEKMSEALKGRTFSEDHKRKIGKANSKPIVQIDSSTNKVVNVWGSSTDAEREGGYNQSAIIACCKNKYSRECNNIYKNYKWQYLHVYMHNIDPRIRKVILFGKEHDF